MKYYKNVRLKDYNYRTGWFFVTNTANFRENYFEGTIRDMLKNELFSLAKATSGAGIDYFHIMPNHIHVILIFENAMFPLHEFWRRFKAITTYKARKSGFIGKSLWQKNYFEHVIRNEKALEQIRMYIRNNPLKLDLPLQEFYEDVHLAVR